MRRSYIWAGLVTVVIAGWLASGYLLPSPPAPSADGPGRAEAGKAEAGKDTGQAFRVRTATLTAQEHTEELVLPGQTEADQRVEVRARTGGIVEKVPHREGDRVEAGAVLCQLDIAERKAALAQARAQLASAQRDFEAAQQLASKKYTSESQLASARAAFDAAQAEVDRIERDIAYTTVTSPIAGIVESRPADLGSFLQVGQACATVTVLDPIVVSAQVSERDVEALSLGMAGSARLVDGQTVEGRLAFISPRANSETRTFRIELDAPNRDGRIRAGITARLVLPLKPRSAHRIPSSALTLDERGRVGVMTVDAGGTARFMPLEILAETREGLWVTGLPETVTLITVGQDYVLDGQPVETVPSVLGANTTPAGGLVEAN